VWLDFLPFGGCLFCLSWRCRVGLPAQAVLGGIDRVVGLDEWLMAGYDGLLEHDSPFGVQFGDVAGSGLAVPVGWDTGATEQGQPGGKASV
jgi:hypothetical protein